MLIAQFAIFLQRLIDDLFQLGRKVRVQADCGNWVAFQNCVEDDCGTFATETAMRPLPFRRGPRRTRTSPCARPVLWPAPAPATYMRPYQESRPDWSGAPRPSNPSAC